MEWFLKVVGNYAGFSGRARRREYWMFVLFYIIFAIAIAVVERAVGLGSATGGGVLSLVYSLGLLIPSLAVTFRRLHDTGRSGWWILLNFLPILGWLVFLFFMAQDGTPGENRYGPSPKAA